MGARESRSELCNRRVIIVRMVLLQLMLTWEVRIKLNSSPGAWFSGVAWFSLVSHSRYGLKRRNTATYIVVRMDLMMSQSLYSRPYGETKDGYSSR